MNGSLGGRTDRDGLGSHFGVCDLGVLVVEHSRVVEVELGMNDAGEFIEALD